MERYLTPTELHQLLEAARRVNDPLAQRDYHIMATLALSGMRIGEFSQVTLGDVWQALKTSYLFIPREHRKGGKRDHKVFVTDALRRHLFALASTNGNPDTTSPLVPGRFGGPMTVRSYQQRISHWASYAGLPLNVTPHWFRHTRAMNIMRTSEAQDPRGVAMAALGHADIRSTGVYTGPAREDVEQALKTVDATKGQRITITQLRKSFERRAG